METPSPIHLETVEESLDKAYETVHKGVSDQVWKTQHPVSRRV